MPLSVMLAIGCGVLWVGCLVWTRRRGSRRAAMIEDGPVPEPIRRALRTTARHSHPSLLNATVLELAEAGVLNVEPADSQRPALVSPGALPHASQLPDYQASVVARLLHRRGVSMQPVPLTALHPSEDPTAAKWHKEFHQQVRREAADRGLLQPTISGPQIVCVFLGGILTSELVADAISHYLHGASGVAAFFPIAALTIGTLLWAARVRPTPAGRALLAEGAPAPTPALERTQPLQEAPISEAPISAPAVKILPNQLQPLPANQVWSDYGGSWHPLDINAKETYAVRSSGLPPALVPLAFAPICMSSLVFAHHDGNSTTVLAFAVFGGLPAAVLAFTAVGVLRRRHLPKRAVIRGQVAKLWTVRSTKGDNSNTEYYCALDVGRGPESVRLKIGGTLFGRLQVGEVVDVLVNPRRRRLKDIRFVGREAEAPQY